MHAARIDTNSKPAKLYRIMSEHVGVWLDAGAMNSAIGYSYCFSTQIAAVRQRVRPNGNVICRRVKEKDGIRHEYMMVLGEMP